MRYHVKGGIWKNTEDEILKAAVMKYGLNQWSRISSLLVRKSAKQCKERWYEWLDPQIKKTEWTKDEEEKLLHLAKMFPCQWRTIAPIVGRTAFQCMEHYEKLLDRAQGRESDENDPRKLRPGEIDPNPETKPARPDPIDMEEDQKEMLNEARARLANTRGKKAKRKAREKQLEEARRLAALQKKRELKSAGIDVVLRLPRKKKKEMNYNVDVPFQRIVPDGSFQVGVEESPQVNKFKGAISLQYLENRNRDEEEEKFRKIDEKRMKNLKQKNLPEAIEKINKMNDPTNIIQRNKLVLPEPQVTEKELEGISKLTSTGLLGTVNSNLQQEYNATKVLVGEYTTQRGVTPVSILRTPKAEDHIMKEAKIAVSLRETQTPLIGGENASEDLNNFLNYKKTEVAFRGNQFKTPAPIVTPNILNKSSILNSTKLTQNNGSKYAQNESKTPLRDEMRINIGEEGVTSWENVSVSVTTSQGNKPVCIKSLLSSLPKPQNKYEIDYSDNTESLLKEIKDVEMKDQIPEDSEDRQERMKKEREERENLEFLHQTRAVQRNLARPYNINQNYKSYTHLKMTLNEGIENQIEDDIKQVAENYIREEMLRLLQYDSINHPIKGNKIVDIKKMDIEMDLEEYTLEEKNFASELIKDEMKLLEKEKKEGANIQYLDKFSNIWEDTFNNEIFYIPEVQMYFHINDIPKLKMYDSLQESFNIHKSMLNKEEVYAKKLFEKSTLLTNGYMKRYSTLSKKYDELIQTIDDLSVKNRIYTNLKEQEEFAINMRQKDLEDQILKLKEVEKEMQLKYKNYGEKVTKLENL